MKVVDTLWFTSMKGCIGIVTIEEDVTGDRKAYIGSVSGRNAKVDTEDIIALGNPFSLDTITRLQHFLIKETKK